MKFQKNAKTPSLALLLCLCAFCPSWGQTESQAEGSTSPPAMKVIEVDYTTLGGLGYFYNDEPLLRYRQFEDLVGPLRDYETSRLLKKSEASDLNARIFRGVGWAGVVTGVIGLLAVPAHQQTGFWIAAIGGGLSIDIGGLFESEAQTSKFNCVQRYNRFARGEEQVLPQIPEDEKSLLNFKKKATRRVPGVPSIRNEDGGRE